MKSILLIFFSFWAGVVSGQKVVNYQETVQGGIQLTYDVGIPNIDRGFTLWLPDNGEAKGLVVFTHSRRDTLNSESIVDHALDAKLGVLYATTDNSVEFFFDNDRLIEVENYIQRALEMGNIPQNNLLFCGMSLEGTRAMKLALFAKGKQSKYRIVPRAIAICDAPLDMVRFHKEMTKAVKLNFSPIAVSEGNWVSGYLEKNLGGTPENVLDAYVRYSPYCYLDQGNTKLSMFDGIAIRAYTEPDINWWLENRRKDYYSMNAIDLAALINGLHIIGNNEAELIVTQDKGYRPDGQRHPHSWSIVDEKELIQWFLTLINT